MRVAGLDEQLLEDLREWIVPHKNVSLVAGSVFRSATGEKIRKKNWTKEERWREDGRYSRDDVILTSQRRKEESRNEMRGEEICIKDKRKKEKEENWEREKKKDISTASYRVSHWLDVDERNQKKLHDRFTFARGSQSWRRDTASRRPWTRIRDRNCTGSVNGNVRSCCFIVTLRSCEYLLMRNFFVHLFLLLYFFEEVCSSVKRAGILFFEYYFTEVTLS